MVLKIILFVWTHTIKLWHLMTFSWNSQIDPISQRLSVCDYNFHAFWTFFQLQRRFVRELHITQQRKSGEMNVMGLFYDYLLKSGHTLNQLWNKDNFCFWLKSPVWYVLCAIQKHTYLKNNMTKCIFFLDHKKAHDEIKTFAMRKMG